jgi:hypothetical protein
MQFSFTVGVNEPHRVDFSFDQFIGNLEIKVDGQTAGTDAETGRRGAGIRSQTAGGRRQESDLGWVSYVESEQGDRAWRTS